MVCTHGTGHTPKFAKIQRLIVYFPSNFEYPLVRQKFIPSAI